MPAPGYGDVIVALLALLLLRSSMSVPAMSVPAMSAPATSVPNTTSPTLQVDPKTIVAAVRSAAAGPAVRVGVVAGAPVCPAGIKPRAGLTLQCLVSFGATPVPFLVTLDASGAPTARPTFPVLSERSVATFAGRGFACGPPKSTVVVAPVGSTVRCTAGSSTLDVVVVDSAGTLRRSATPSTTRHA